jgi:WNK lysine deficient protein kinase
MSKPALDPSTRFAQLGDLVSSEPNVCLYSAYDSQTGNMVTVIRQYLSEMDKVHIQGLIDRMDIITTFSSPHLPRLLGFWVDAKSRSLSSAYEYTGSHSIKWIMLHDDVCFSSHAISRWFNGVTHALAHIESHKLFHGRINIRTIFINPASVVKLAMPVPAYFGSPIFHIRYWTPPEAFRGIFDARGDVWMLGIAVLFTLTMVQPYAECRSPAELFRKLAAGQPPDALGTVTDEVAAGFIKKCLVPYEQRATASRLLGEQFLDCESVSTKQSVTEHEVLV